ncbi:MAG: DUF4290 domain-containing protein [Bacteroidetes bacterium]|nr:DUF4290 domain-containing protein [Bacteroidota bacterium]
MEYNTTRSMMILPEYGRNVQNMISHAMEIADREERNRAAQAIIEVMGQLNPHLRDVDDYRHKLWTHLFVMSSFKLDVDSPYEIPKEESLQEKPQRMVYPKSKIRYGHYGKYTERILLDAKNIENAEEKAYLQKAMGDFMKTQFLTFNNDAVENNLIATQMAELSKGHLILENPDDLISTNLVLKSIGRTSNTNAKTNNRKSKPKKKRI